MSHCASEELTLVDSDVLKLLMINQQSASMKNYPRRCVFMLNNGGNLTSSQRYSREIILCRGANAMLIHLSPTITIWSTSLTRPPTCNIGRLKQAISNTLHCLYFRFSTHMFYDFGTILHYLSLLLAETFEVGDPDSTTWYNRLRFLHSLL